MYAQRSFIFIMAETKIRAKYKIFLGVTIKASGTWALVGQLSDLLKFPSCNFDYGSLPVNMNPSPYDSSLVPAMRSINLQLMLKVAAY